MEKQREGIISRLFQEVSRVLFLISVWSYHLVCGSGSVQPHPEVNISLPGRDEPPLRRAGLLDLAEVRHGGDLGEPGVSG